MGQADHLAGALIYPDPVLLDEAANEREEANERQDRPRQKDAPSCSAHF